MRQLGRHVLHIDVQIEELDHLLEPLVAGRAPQLVAVHGVGVEVASSLLVAWDNAHRIRSQAAFASLCGVALFLPARARPTDIVSVVGATGPRIVPFGESC